MMKPLSALAAALLTSALAACGSDDARHRSEHQEAPWHPAVAILLAYDANHDGTVTRAEMDAGLHADFAKADYKHLGRLDADEVRAVNQQRIAADQSTASPLVDWNHDGYVDFDEFAAEARSLFDQLDRKGDGKLTPDELNPNPPKKGDGTDDTEGEHGHRHRGGDGTPPQTGGGN
jgi:Ca2+-binding EF-hand superfamily protein